MDYEQIDRLLGFRLLKLGSSPANARLRPHDMQENSSMSVKVFSHPGFLEVEGLSLSNRICWLPLSLKDSSVVKMFNIRG